MTIEELRIENEILKKFQILHQATTRLKIEFIDLNKNKFSISRMCSVLNITRQNYYK